MRGFFTRCDFEGPDRKYSRWENQRPETRPGGPQAPPAESFCVRTIFRSCFFRYMTVKSVLRLIFCCFRVFRLERQPENSVLPVLDPVNGRFPWDFCREIAFQGFSSRFSDPMDISRARSEVFGHRRCPYSIEMTRISFFGP